jgi:hypothetical protein
MCAVAGLRAITLPDCCLRATGGDLSGTFAQRRGIINLNHTQPDYDHSLGETAPILTPIVLI